MLLYLAILFLFTGNISTTSPATDRNFKLSGIITDAETGEPVSFAYVHLEELNRTTVADADGWYELKNIPSGTYTINIHRIGYRTQNISVEITDADKTLDIHLRASVLGSQSIDVIGSGENLEGSNLEHVSKKVFGEELRRNLGSTLSQTLSNLPGIDEQSMGSAPGRPVIRGLGDERVLILQDGIRSGDVSSQSSDHAVTIDPISAQEVEIARGPAALAYGANAIGGVINIVRNQIETSVPSRINGSFTLNGETVNNGLSAALDATIPVKDLALSLDLNGRTASDISTPLGEIENSQYSSTNNAIGLSWIRNWGYIGGAFSTYFNNYGIPPNPLGGHEHGVNIELEKFQYDVKSEILIGGPFLKVIEGDFSIKNYSHREIEDDGIHGTQFGLVTTNAEVKALHNAMGFLEEGSIGIWGEMEDYAVIGAQTPDANSYKIGSYIIEESNFGDLHLEGGLRFDWVLNKPAENQQSSIGYIRERNFPALSSSVAAVYELSKRFSTGASLLHSFRAPSLEELYSEGPHLASYSYEIGNPDLEPERGLAKELFIRYQSNIANAEIALFHNDFSNFLYAQDTGQPSTVDPNLNVYQFVGTEAVLYGFEFSGEVQTFKNFLLDASVSYTFAEHSNNEPLPQIPPLKSNVGLRFIDGSFELGSRLRLAADQQRVGEFESPTDGFAILDLFTQYRLNTGKLLHTFSLKVNNLLNEEYYNHLSRIKEIRPEPGRNFSILYRVFF